MVLMVGHKPSGEVHLNSSFSAVVVCLGLNLNINP